MPKKECSKQGCTKLIDSTKGSRCEDHNRNMEYKEQRIDHEHQQFYICTMEKGEG
jgi:hypothetical protein